MEIKVEDYLDVFEMRKIVEEEFREAIKQHIKAAGVEVFIKNISYRIVLETINKEIPDYEKEIKSKIKKQIKSITNYDIFREKDDALYLENSLGKQYLDQAVEDNKEILNKKVVEIFKKIDEQHLSQEIETILCDKIENMFKGEK